MGKRFGILLCTLVMFACLVAQGNAATTPVDLTDTAWDVIGVLKASVQSVGSIQSLEQLSLEFTDDEFYLYDADDELVFSGTYTTDAKGTAILSPDEDELKLLLKSLIDEVLLEKLVDDDIIDVIYDEDDITVQSLTIVAKPKASGDIASLSLSMSVKTVVDAIVEDDVGMEEVSAKVTLAFKGTATKNLGSLTGSDWDIAARESIVIKGAGKATNDVDLFLELSDKATGFGPSAVFAAEVNGEDSFSGTYINKKNKITLQMTDLEDFVTSRIMENITTIAGVEPGDITDFWIDAAKYKAGASIKPGVSVSFSMVVTYSGEAMVQGEDVDFTGSYSLKGNGTPAAGE